VREREARGENLAARYCGRWGKVDVVGLVAFEEHRITQLLGVVVVFREGIESGSRGISEELIALRELCA
jgi:hypothetical protein